MDGTMATAILQWRFDDESLWRGLSDNTKLARLARSMVSSGFLEDERSVAKLVVASLDSGRAAGGHPSGSRQQCGCTCAGGARRDWSETGHGRRIFWSWTAAPA